MPSKKPTTTVAACCFLIVTGLSCFVNSYTAAARQTNAAKDTTIATYIDKMAEFPGNMMKYISGNLTYPELDKKNGIEGKIIARFVILKDGNIGNVTIIRSLTPSIDSQVITLIRKMPKWKPASYRGVPVNSYYTFPMIIHFE